MSIMRVAVRLPRTNPVVGRAAVLYAILCYNSEAVVNACSREQDDAAVAQRRSVMRDLLADGKLGAVARLLPTTTAITLRPGRETLILDGPFAETKEQLLGFFVVDCRNLEEAIDHGRRLLGESGAIEIRPVQCFHSSNDFTRTTP